MDTNQLRKEFTEYAERMAVIRQLSSPVMMDIDSADGYSERLQNNFTEIGKLAAINRDMLDQYLFPLLAPDAELDDETADILSEFADMLLTMAGGDEEFENLDLPINAIISDKLLNNKTDSDDISLRIRRMDALLVASYSLMNMTERITECPEISGAYKKRGVELGEEFISLLDESVFTTIPDIESRDIVLMNARFMPAFFERSSDSNESKRNFEVLDWMYDIPNDCFYNDALPDKDWRYHRFRTLEAFAISTDVLNLRGFDREQLNHIGDMADQLEELIQSDPEYYNGILGCGFVPVAITRCRYLCGRITLDEYKNALLNAYNSRNKDDFGPDGGYFNVLIPLEYMCLLDKENLNSREINLLKRFYQDLGGYALRISNYGSLSFILEYFLLIISKYIEIPSVIGIEEFVLRFLVAIHPPTYVHSRMVGQICERLCYYLLKYDPEMFVGMPGYETVDDVLNSREEIINYAYHAAIMHDAGKIYIVDTILIYGRKLLDMEFELIKSHPLMGYSLLKQHKSTEKYAEVALYHHKWYDDSRGYPFDKKSSDSPYKTIIDIVQCADCLDAATDSVGRSYNKGKTIDDFMDELKEGSGTRYAPWLYDLFLHKDVYSDLVYLLDEGRKINYRDTYSILRDVLEKDNLD